LRIQDCGRPKTSQLAFSKTSTGRSPKISSKKAQKMIKRIGQRSSAASAPSNSNSQMKDEQKKKNIVARLFGLVIVVYVGTIVWLEGPLTKNLLSQGKAGPSIGITQGIRKLENQSRREQPNFLPRVLAVVFPQFHQDGKIVLLFVFGGRRLLS
jgi:hypothetical protein